MRVINVGKDNSTFQEIVALKENRNKRAQKKQFFVEGVQNIKEAIANKWDIEAFVYSKATQLSSWAKSVVDKAKINYVLDENLMKRLSDKEETSELLAIINMNKMFDNVIYNKKPIFVLLDRPSKKGNLGTIIRSCDALNVDQIWYSGHSVDVYDHAVITASMGSFFKMPITFIESNEDFTRLVNNLREKYSDIKVVATSLQTQNRVQDYDFNRPVLLLIGNETKGLSKFYNENTDDFIKISMKGGVDSLNVACGTTACLYEINRQRNFN